MAGAPYTTACSPKRIAFAWADPSNCGSCELREPLAGQRVLVGTLRGLDGERVLLETEGGSLALDMNNIAKARLTL